KVIVLALTVVAFIGSIMLIPGGFIGSEFIGSGDRGEVNFQLELPKNATVEQTNLATAKVEDYLKKYPEITKIFTTVGATSSSQEGQSSAYEAEVFVALVNVEERDFSTQKFSRIVKAELESQIPGVKVTPVPVGMVGSGQAPIQVVSSGADLDSLLAFSQQVITE